MKNRTEEQKDTIMKTFAIAGFVSVIIVIAFLIIKIVGFLPSAFSSLASLADGIYTSEDTSITVVAEETIVNSGEPVGIRWSAPAASGRYVFSYDCTGGLAVTIDTAGGSRAVTCDTDYDLGNTRDATLTITSERNRFSDLTYHIGYVPEGMDEPLISNNDLITVVNANISPLAGAATSSTETATGTITTTEGDEDEAPESTVEEADEPDAPVPTPTPAPQETTEFVYEIPVSNPNGYTDLSVRFLGVGTLDGDNRFAPRVTLDNDVRSAIRFEVKNLGTRTSEEWSFEAELPNGTDYESSEQPPLRPNERSVITLGFDLTDETGITDFSVSIDTDRDTFSGNDRFGWAVEIVN